jgi:transposase
LKRRGFYELATPGPSPIASEALEHVAALYPVEKDIRGRHADERRTARKQRSRPLIDALEPWLRARLGLISQKSKLGDAIMATSDSSRLLACIAHARLPTGARVRF